MEIRLRSQLGKWRCIWGLSMSCTPPVSNAALWPVPGSFSSSVLRVSASPSAPQPSCAPAIVPDRRQHPFLSQGACSQLPLPLLSHILPRPLPPSRTVRPQLLPHRDSVAPGSSAGTLPAPAPLLPPDLGCLSPLTKSRPRSDNPQLHRGLTIAALTGPPHVRVNAVGPGPALCLLATLCLALPTSKVTVCAAYLPTE